VKQILLLLLCIPIGLSARDYTISPPDSEVVCTLSTIPKDKLLTLIKGDLEKTYINQPGEKYRVEPLRALCENYMAVKVIIKNNSSSTIVINHNDYLDGLEQVSTKCLSTAYKNIMNKHRFDRIGNGIISTILLGGSFLSFIGGVATIDDNEQVAVSLFLASLFLGPTGIFAGIKYMQSRSKYSNTKKTKEWFFHKMTKKGNSTTAPRKIHPGGLYRDIFFVDLTRTNRTILARTTPMLHYETI